MRNFDDVVRSLIADRDAARNEAANLRVKLSAHDREVRAAALEEAADDFPPSQSARGWRSGAMRFLRARAAALREGR